MIDENLISIIVCETDEKMCEGLLDELQKLEIPEGMKVDVQVIRASEGKLAAAYNEGMRQSNAKYRFFIDESARKIDSNLIHRVINLFYETDAGVLGLFGSEMPLNGNFARHVKGFGMYVQYDTADVNKGNVTEWENPLWAQRVHCLDGRFIAVTEDIEWDEEVGDSFAAAALCTRYRKAGYDCIVPMQDGPWMIFGKPSYYAVQQNQNTAAESKLFFKRYWDTIQPLVSVLIPTYNQPKYFEQALRSALEQDYRNIEIIVGDDSTNEETKQLMEREYLKKYPQIRYFFHGKPLGGHGIKNIEFILNHAEGEFISFLFHDDIYYPTKISRMVKCYEEDLTEELGIVTSTRNIIDENDKILGRFNPWLPSTDTIITAEHMAKGIFSHMSNYIGELTTVLLRKKFLRQESGEHCYRIGMYCGIMDTEQADVSTFLEMCKAGRSCMFLKDTLSAFRTHSGQNTGKLAVALGALMEWMDYIILSWVNGVYIHSWEQLTEYLSIWYPWAVGEFNRVVERYEGEIMPEAYVWCRALFEVLGRREYEKAVDISISYMMKRAEDTGVLTRVCCKDENGLWRKR